MLLNLQVTVSFGGGREQGGEGSRVGREREQGGEGAGWGGEQGGEGAGWGGEQGGEGAGWGGEQGGEGAGWGGEQGGEGSRVGREQGGEGSRVGRGAGWGGEQGGEGSRVGREQGGEGAGWGGTRVGRGAGWGTWVELACGACMTCMSHVRHMFLQMWRTLHCGGYSLVLLWSSSWLSAVTSCLPTGRRSVSSRRCDLDVMLCLGQGVCGDSLARFGQCYFKAKEPQEIHSPSNQYP